MALRLQATVAERGWGSWAVEVPAVVGWRLTWDRWGFGHAAEAASAALDFALDHLSYEQVVAFTASTNLRSMR